MGGFAALLGSIGGGSAAAGAAAEATAGSTIAAEGAATAGSTIAADSVGSAIASEGAGMAGNAIAAEGAGAAGSSMAAEGAGALSSTKDFFSQAWNAAKNEGKEMFGKFVARDENGGIDAGATAYKSGKAMLSRAYADGGDMGSVQQPMPDMSLGRAQEAPQAEAAAAPNAEDELNKLRNRMNM